MPEQSRGRPASVFATPAIDEAVAGIGAGLSSVMCMHPLDLLKVQFQVSSKPLGIVSALRSNIQTSGWQSLYRGLGPNLLGNASGWGLYFWGYTMLKDRIGARERKLGMLEHLACAATSGSLSAAATNPIWVIKTRVVTGSATYPTAFHGLWKIGREEGIRGLWKGTTLAVIGVSNGAIQFMAYEEMKRRRRDFKRRRDHLPSVAGTDDLPLGTLEYIALSGSSKLFAIGLTYPYQVIRSRMQNQSASSATRTNVSASKDTAATTFYTSIRHCIQHTYIHEGFRAFYRGLAPNAIRVLPGTCVTFLVYEKLSSSMKTWANPGAIEE